MPFPEVGVINQFSSTEEIADEIAKMQKYLQWLLANLDSLNVRELTADHISAGTIDVDLGINIESATGGVYIDSTGIEIYNGNFRVYDDAGLTALIDGGTFYGDNILVTGNIFIGEDLYMNADYTSSQERRIYPFQNDDAIYIVMAPGVTGVDPTCQFIGFNEVYCSGQLTCDEIFTCGNTIYMNTNQVVATENYCDNAISSHESRCINYATA